MRKPQPPFSPALVEVSHSVPLFLRNIILQPLTAAIHAAYLICCGPFFLDTQSKFAYSRSRKKAGCIGLSKLSVPGDLADPKMHTERSMGRER